MPSVLIRRRSSRAVQPPHAHSRRKREAKRFREQLQPRPRLNRKARQSKSSGSSHSKGPFREQLQPKPRLNRKARQSKSSGSSHSKGPFREQLQPKPRLNRKARQSKSRNRSQRGDKDRRKTIRNVSNEVKSKWRHGDEMDHHVLERRAVLRGQRRCSNCHQRLLTGVELGNRKAACHV